LRSFSGELPWRLAAKTSKFQEGTSSWLLGSLATKTTLPRGNWQLDAQSLVAEIAQFLEGTGSLMLGAVGWKK